MAEKKEPPLESKIWRISFCRMWYSIAPKKRETPTPFAEFRAFIFLKDKPPTPLLELSIKRRLKDAVDKLKEICPSIIESYKNGTADFDDKTLMEEVKATKKEGIIKIEIDGYEIEPMDIMNFVTIVNDNEIMLHLLKQTPKKIPFDEIYRYMAFFSQTGMIKKDYDEFEIRELEQREPEEEKSE
jgi:hypothetical protein